MNLDETWLKCEQYFEKCIDVFGKHGVSKAVPLNGDGVMAKMGG